MRGMYKAANDAEPINEAKVEYLRMWWENQRGGRDTRYNETKSFEYIYTQSVESIYTFHLTLDSKSTVKSNDCNIPTRFTHMKNEFDEIQSG